MLVWPARRRLSFCSSSRILVQPNICFSLWHWSYSVGAKRVPGLSRLSLKSAIYWMSGCVCVCVSPSRRCLFCWPVREEPKPGTCECWARRSSLGPAWGSRPVGPCLELLLLDCPVCSSLSVGHLLKFQSFIPLGGNRCQVGEISSSFCALTQH